MKSHEVAVVTYEEEVLPKDPVGEDGYGLPERVRVITVISVTEIEHEKALGDGCEIGKMNEVFRGRMILEVHKIPEVGCPDPGANGMNFLDRGTIQQAVENIIGKMLEPLSLEDGAWVSRTTFAGGFQFLD